ncbi:U1-C [Theobroma cacao]|nr:U1-C [Theobroma cacao]
MPRYYCDYCSIYLTHDSFWRWVHHQWSGEDPPSCIHNRGTNIHLWSVQDDFALTFLDYRKS